MTARNRIAALAAISLLAGCIVPVPRGTNPLELKFMKPEELSEYSEQVFRHHNRVMTRLMMAPLEVESLSSAQAMRLERAEARMNDSCEALNQAASQRSEGQDTGFWLENQVRQTVRRCSAETRALEDLLAQLGISE